MQLGEAVGMGIIPDKKNSPTCKKQEKKEKYDWKARVNGLGKDSKKCSGTNLFNEMKPRKDEHFKDKNLGFVPEKKSNAHWLKEGLDGVDPQKFPLQAHHLIPKNFLPKQGVCVWLCEKYDKHPKYKLAEDTYYNTDHANNGYAMPYATPLKEWKAANKAEEKCHVAFRVMEKTKIQLHQGSHAEVLNIAKVNEKLAKNFHFQAAPSAPAGESDEMEDASIQAPGYLNAIKQWLNAIASQIDDHVESCTKGCKKDESGKKTKVRPLEDSVRLMNQVSYVAKVFLTMHLIFTCPYGAAYARQNDLLTWDEESGKYRAKGVKKGALEKALGR